MYRGFDLRLEKNDFSREHFGNFYNFGLKCISNQKNSIIEKLNSFVGENGSLDGSKMQENWFPQVEADVFISHSHKDVELAIALAGWLKDTFELTAFIDSCVWGYSDDLLKQIDNNYCFNDKEGSYSYKKRNYSTSHVHMMLSVALTQMIDKAECLFFLNTPNSLTPNPDRNQTESPWIYFEISTSRLIRKKELKEYRFKALCKALRSYSSGGALNVKYDLPTDHLVDINTSVLNKWAEMWNNVSLHDDFPQYSSDLSVHALDKLYELTKSQHGK